MSKSTSNRGGHRPSGWSNVAVDLHAAGLQHVGKRMDRELAAAEAGAQFGSKPNRSDEGKPEIIRVPRIARNARWAIQKLTCK